MTKITYVIFHGAYGDVKGNWFPYLKKELTNLGQEVIIDQYPVEDWKNVEKAGKSFKPTKQTLSNWMHLFEKNTLPQLKGKKLCFVGHSLGPVFILHLIEKHHLYLECGIFVMPFIEALNTESAWQFDVVNSSFYKKDFDFKRLKKYIPHSYVIYSDNDPFVDVKLALAFGQKLDSCPILIKKSFHISAPLFQKNPLVLELCKTILDPKDYLK